MTAAAFHLWAEAPAAPGRALSAIVQTRPGAASGTGVTLKPLSCVPEFGATGHHGRFWAGRTGSQRPEGQRVLAPWWQCLGDQLSGPGAVQPQRKGLAWAGTTVPWSGGSSPSLSLCVTHWTRGAGSLRRAFPPPLLGRQLVSEPCAASNGTRGIRRVLLPGVTASVPPGPSGCGSAPAFPPAAPPAL